MRNFKKNPLTEDEFRKIQNAITLLQEFDLNTASITMSLSFILPDSTLDNFVLDFTS